ncbi:MAG: hypothetical protein JJT93_01220 [Gammaproteobacteria bacterium]|nr:hypothetical protein [Gammaproteobacteria bacterium]
MTDIQTLKADLHACLDTADDNGGLDEPHYEKLMGLIDALAAQNPHIARERPEMVAGSWETLFASFGARHSSGKTVRHAADLQIHSLGKLPKAQMQVLSIIQEIDEQGEAYNNVVDFECGPDNTPGRLIVRGRFSCTEDAPIRYQVRFYRADAQPRDGSTEDSLRAGLGLPADESLSAEFPPPPFFSDILFVDEELRINRGNFGGTYVLKRRSAPALSLGEAS